MLENTAIQNAGSHMPLLTIFVTVRVANRNDDVRHTRAGTVDPARSVERERDLDGVYSRKVATHKIVLKETAPISR